MYEPQMPPSSIEIQALRSGSATWMHQKDSASGLDSLLSFRTLSTRVLFNRYSILSPQQRLQRARVSYDKRVCPRAQRRSLALPLHSTARLAPPCRRNTTTKCTSAAQCRRTRSPRRWAGQLRAPRRADRMRIPAPYRLKMMHGS